MRYHFEFEPKYDLDPESYDLWTLVVATTETTPLNTVDEVWLHDDHYLLMVDIEAKYPSGAFAQGNALVAKYIREKQ